jgi:hypothetical protein
MNKKTCCIAREKEGYEGFEQLMERGRILHSHAIYDAFAWMATRVKLSLKNVVNVQLEAGN